MAVKYIDLTAVEMIMEEIDTSSQPARPASVVTVKKVRIGILKDAAFQFYYPENLKALNDEGAELVEINAMTAGSLPEIDALYIGGGFPETGARRLSENGSFRDSVKLAAESGLPIYAECGGLIYLGESILLDDKEYPLAGVFPVRFGLQRKPQAHGYTELSVDGNNPFYEKGEKIRGHEFRYSEILSWDGAAAELAFEMQRGVGFKEGRDGLVKKNVLALYTHIHSLSTPQWAASLVARAHDFKKQK
jgi:cobyrinic acid a,c-diamide synthase